MIVECPGCRSRYDVSGRPPGTLARCRCGTVFELPDPPRQAAALECPRCGGHAAATNHACEFCGIDLLVKACPRCFARMFHGSKHCSQCGAGVVEPATADPEGMAQRRKCPRCGDRPLEARLIGEVLLDDCPACLGTFVDITALERILRERRPDHVQAMLGRLAPAQDNGLPPPMPSGSAVYVACPDCGKLMNRRSFAQGAGVIVDVCRSHGTWFDKDELARVVEFAMGGGLERAKERDLERERERERQMRSSQRMAAVPLEPSGPLATHSRLARLDEVFSALGGFLSSIINR